MGNNRILIVDDNPNIHEDFQKILAPVRLAAPLLGIEERLFGDEAPGILDRGYAYQLDAAAHASQALSKFKAACDASEPFALVFADVRLPPGKNGIEMIEQMWTIAPQTQVVVMTAFSDYSWEDLIERFGWSDRLVILRKPFDAITIKQLALVLTRRWSSELALAAQAERMARLETEVKNQAVEYQRFRAAFDQAREGFALLSDEGLLYDCNEALAGMLRCPRERLLGRELSSWVPVEERVLWREPGLFETSFMRSDQAPLRVEISLSRTNWDGRCEHLAIIRERAQCRASSDD